MDKYLIESYLIFLSWPLNRPPRCHSHDLADIGRGQGREGCSLTTLTLLKTLRQLIQMEFMPNESFLV